MNLTTATNEYLKSRSKRLRRNSIEAYTVVLRKLGAFLGEERELASIRDTEIDDFQLAQQGRLSPTTQQHYANVLRTFFKFWAIRGQSSIIYQAIEGPRRKEHRPNFITAGQFRLIDESLTDREYHQLTRKVIFNLLWDTGMRIGELLSLDLADIETDKHYVVITTEKSKKLRMLVWSEYTHRLLLRYLGIRLCMNQAPELFQTPGGTGTAKRRTRLTARSVQRWCVELGKELGFRINPHAFRHGKMHEIINSGGNRQHVQAIAGHSSITSSEVYVRLNEQEQFRLQNRFLASRAEPRLAQTYPQAELA